MWPYWFLPMLSLLNFFLTSKVTRQLLFFSCQEIIFDSPSLHKCFAMLLFFMRWWYYKFKCSTSPSSFLHKMKVVEKFPYSIFMYMIQNANTDKWDSMSKKIMGNLHCNTMRAIDFLGARACAFNINKFPSRSRKKENSSKKPRRRKYIKFFMWVCEWTQDHNEILASRSENRKAGKAKKKSKVIENR